jgi:rare lipoprotein A
MRGLIFIVALSLAELNGFHTAAAHAEESTAPSARKSQGHGFDWFFANVKRPIVPCAGEHVVATWYTTGSHTATGEVFNPHGHTAAHRFLPFGSRVTVINPRNGQSITVVINDRGPFVKGVTLDLALGAARAIGMKETQWVCMADVSQ